jgi:hypothetical protein
MHLRADGRGPVPQGRALCELSAAGDFDPYLSKDRTTPSAVRDAGSGEPTCRWCRTRELPP